MQNFKQTEKEGRKITKDLRVGINFSVFMTAFLFLFFLSISFSSAVPPVQTSTIVDTGISIEAPIIEYLQEGELFKFHIHAYNSTDGTRLDNNSISCLIHLYGSNGGHIIEDTMGFDSNGIDFKYDVLGGNFTIGQHAVLFDCQNGNIGGFLEYPFEVTPSGRGGNANIMLFVIALVLIYGINLFGFFGKNIPMTILGGGALMFLGVYMLNNGVIIYQDSLTNYMAYITISWGFISAMWAALEQFDVI